MARWAIDVACFGVPGPMLSGDDCGFVRAFLAKDRLNMALARIPVRVSLNKAAGLVGAAHCVVDML